MKESAIHIRSFQVLRDYPIKNMVLMWLQTISHEQFHRFYGTKRLVGDLEPFFFPISNFIIPLDELIFISGVETYHQPVIDSPLSTIIHHH